MQRGTVIRVFLVAVLVLALGVGAYVSLVGYYDLPVGEVAKEREPTSEETKQRGRTASQVAEKTEETAGKAEKPPEEAAAEPEKNLALYYSYLNRGAWEQAYGLLSSESKEQVSLEQYKAVYQSVGDLNFDISVSSAEVRGDTATLDVIRSFEIRGIAGEDRQTRQMVREGGAWRVVLSDEELELFT